MQKTLESDLPAEESVAADGARRRLWTARMLLVGVTLIAYQPAFEAAFVFDDRTAILGNSTIRSIWPLDGFIHGRRPLGLYSFALNYAVGGLDPFGYHAVNVLLHIASGLLLFGLTRRTLREGRLAFDEWRATVWAFALSLCWLVHPLNTQAVTYVVQRFESLAGFFGLLVLHALVRGASSTRWSRWWFALAVVACWLAFWSKENAVAIPIVAVLFDAVLVSGSWRTLLRRRWAVHLGLLTPFLWLVPHVLPTVLPGGDAVVASAGPPSAGFAMHDISWFEYLRTQPEVILHYLRLSVWPSPLCFDYAWPVANDPWRIGLTTFVVSMLLVAGVHGVLRGSPLGLAGAWFFVLLAPTSSFLPINDLANEHRVYLPLIGVLVLVIAGTEALVHRIAAHAGRRTVASIGAGCLLLVTACWFVGWTNARNRDYESAIAIWERTLELRPDNSRAHYNLAAELQRRERFEPALRHYQRAIEIGFAHPHLLVEAHRGAAWCAIRSDRLDEARRQLGRGVTIAPGRAALHNDLGFVEFREGRFEAALVRFETAVRLGDRTSAPRNVAFALYELGRVDEAIDQLRSFVDRVPSDEKAERTLESWTSKTAAPNSDT